MVVLVKGGKEGGGCSGGVRITRWVLVVMGSSRALQREVEMRERRGKAPDVQGDASVGMNMYKMKS